MKQNEYEDGTKQFTALLDYKNYLQPKTDRVF